VPRIAKFQTAVDTSFFTPLQLQPRTSLSLTWNSFARWLSEYLVSFPELIGKEHVGAVIMSIGVRYFDDVRFFDCPVVDVSASVVALGGGSRLKLVTVLHSGQQRISEVTLLLCPVRVEEPTSLAARPSPLPPHLLERLSPDEQSDAKPERRVPRLLERIRTTGRPLGVGKSQFIVDRHLCEVADQWSFVELPCVCESSRNALAFEHLGAEPGLRHALDTRLERFDVELTKPYFSFDHGLINSQAYELEGVVYFVHELSSSGAVSAPRREPVGSARHGVVIETFGRADA
jgi:hypothetical protein